MAKLSSEAKGIKGVVVAALLAASNTFVSARRLATGTALAHAHTPPSNQQQLAAWLMVAVLAPVYALAQKLVFSKVGLRGLLSYVLMGLKWLSERGGLDGVIRLKGAGAVLAPVDALWHESWRSSHGVG